MGRPTVKSIDYYPIDCDFLSDIKIRRIMKSCGASAIAVIIYLLGNIYGDEGYYMRWNDDIKFLVADYLSVSEKMVSAVIEKALQVEFFDKEKFDNYKILTSKGIQKRYFLITEKRKNDHIFSEFIIKKTEYGRVSAEETPVIAEEKRKEKEKEAKRKRKDININKIKTNKRQIDLYTKNADLKNSLCVFVEHRNKLNKPFSDTAFNSFLQQLDDLSGGDDRQKIMILRASIMNGWINIYPLASKGGSVPKSRMNEYYLSDKRQTDDYTEEELKELLGIKGI